MLVLSGRTSQGVVRAPKSRICCLLGSRNKQEALAWFPCNNSSFLFPLCLPLRMTAGSEVPVIYSKILPERLLCARSVLGL